MTSRALPHSKCTFLSLFSHIFNGTFRHEWILYKQTCSLLQWPLRYVRLPSINGNKNGRHHVRNKKIIQSLTPVCAQGALNLIESSVNSLVHCHFNTILYLKGKSGNWSTAEYPSRITTNCWIERKKSAKFFVKKPASKA